MSDIDAAFKGTDCDDDQTLQKILSDNNAVFEPVKRNGHDARAVTDVFAKNLRRVLSSKEFLKNKSTEWVTAGSILPKLLNNTTTHHTHH
jgi:hypothetical protein